jgi:phosphoglycerate kinase
MGVKLYLPVDVVAADRMDDQAIVKMVPVQEIPVQWRALDIGPATLTLYSEALYDARTILWNGPMGMFEVDAFSRGTMGMAHSLANTHALTIVGGGETGEAVQKSGVADRITYISTGGGAFLSFLEGDVLPGVAALESV